MALIDDKVAVFAADVDKVHRIVNGPESGDQSTVVTDGGAVKTLARIGAEAAVVVQNAVDSFLQDQTLVDGPVINWDLSLGNTARVTLGALAAGQTRTLKTPTNPKRTSGYLMVNQDAVGNRKIDAWDSGWRFAGGLVPVLSTGPNKQDVFFYVCDGTSFFVTHSVIGAAAPNTSGSLDPVGTPAPATIPAPQPITMQAEDAELYGSLHLTTPADFFGVLTGYEGTGFVTDFEQAGDKIIFRFPGILAGQYDIELRHGRGNNTPTENYITINTAPRAQLLLPATGPNGDGTQWGTFTIPNVPLQPGMNVITIEKKDGFFALDRAKLIWKSGSLVAPPPAGSTTPPPPPPAPPPPPPPPAPAPGAGTSTVKIQAEDAVLAGTLFVQTEAAANGYVWPGYEGAGWVSWFTDPSDLLTFNFTGLTAGNYDVYVRTTRENVSPQQYSIQGGSFVTANLPGGNGWEDFKIPNIAADGTGKITLALRKQDGYFHVDSARVAPAGLVAAPPPPPPPPPTNLGGGEGYPFGSRKIAYSVANISPANDVQAKMDQTIISCYDQYKAANIVQNNQIVSGGWVVKFNAQNLYVSEGMGFGLMMVAAMAGHDPQAQAIAEGMFKVARARPAYGVTQAGYPGGAYLMNWRTGPNGEADGASGGGDGWSAYDGDLDFAFGMLMCNRQWGSNGNVNWLQEARNTIAALKAWAFYPDGRINGRPHALTMRTSDIMPQHFQAFYDATGDVFWLTAIDRNIQELEEIIAAKSPTYALMPDSLVATDQHPPQLPGVPGPTDGSATEMYFAWNAIRNPWRLGCGYQFVADASVQARLKSICLRISQFFRQDTGNQPGHLATVYDLNGTVPNVNGALRPYVNYWYPNGTIGCALPAAMVDASLQDWLNALWAFNRDNYNPGYYNGDMMLFGMLMASRNWWHPTTVPS